MFKYSLEKSSKKFVCPNCNRKTLVRYIDNEQNLYLKESIGRCDRESKCGYHCKPDLQKTLTQLPYQEKLVKPIQSYINNQEVSIHGRDFKKNNFIQFLKNHFSITEIKSVILKYCIGTSNHWNGATVFWQINDKEKIVTGKVMLYDKIRGQRIKTPFNHINWMHKILKLENYNLSQCLFGLHLINEKQGEIIAITESEKTAVIMSLFLPKYIWMATGSKTNFKEQLLEPLKKHKIIAFPDKSEFEDWNKTSLQLNKIGYSITCSDLLEKRNYPEGFDLADIYFKNKLAHIPSKNEIKLRRLRATNPLIMDLINTFDLIY